MSVHKLTSLWRSSGYRACGSSLYLMTGMRDVTTVYVCRHSIWKKFQNSPFADLASFLLKMISRVYAIAILTSPLHRVNSALQLGTNISISEIWAKWSVFSGTVTFS